MFQQFLDTFVLVQGWLLEHVVGYEVAFKLITVLGTFGLPLAAWLLFRLMEPSRWLPMNRELTQSLACRKNGTLENAPE